MSKSSKHQSELQSGAKVLVKKTARKSANPSLTNRQSGVGLAQAITPADALVQPPQPDLSMSGTGSMDRRAQLWSRWRERYNPLRGLTIARAVTLLEQYQRGEMADPCWAYFFIENGDADLFAIIERRESAMQQLDWNIKLVSSKWKRVDTRHQSFDAQLADEQAECLREAYERLDNLEESIAHLQLATFRGFAHVEKYHRPDGNIFHLELVDQWNMVRDLLRGEWKYNPDARNVTYYGLPADNMVDRNNFLIREKDRHVNRIGILKAIRSGLSDKDWDGFIEIYGIPSGVIIGPPGVQPEKEAEYQAAAQAIADGAGGYIPFGSTYVQNKPPTGDTPFKVRLDYLTEKLVLAGTGGLLTMLAQSGSGTLAGGAHQEAFDTLARAEAKTLSRVYNRSFDSEILEREFPGQPRLAYFEIAANDELDPEKISVQAMNFKKAGFSMSAAELSEKSGYQLFDDASRSDAGLAVEDEEETLEEDPLKDPEEQQQQKKSEGAEIKNRLSNLSKLPEIELPAAIANFVANELPAICNRAHPSDAKAAQTLCNRVAAKLMLK